MDHALRTISYIADIGDLVVLMARRRMITQDGEDPSNKIAKTPKMVCHVFESEEVRYIATFRAIKIQQQKKKCWAYPESILLT